jgi:hypothetical protein
MALQYPWPPSIEKSEYPSGYAVREYVQSYVAHFNLMPHIM